MKRSAPYERPINDYLAKLGLSGKYDPRHVEAYMRTGHPTLDGLYPNEFLAEVKLAVSCIDYAGTEVAEESAQSHGM